MGDAAHLMTPFAGVRVNVALTDALDLAQALESVVARGQGRDGSNQVCCNMEHLAGALQGYEKKMFVRAQEAAKESYGSLQMLFAENAEEQMVGVVKAMVAREN